MSKRIKMRPSDMEKIGVYYYMSARGKHIGSGTPGTRYTLCDSLSDEQRKEIEQYRNTEIGTARYMYAPEIRRDTLIIYDKCIR